MKTVIFTVDGKLVVHNSQQAKPYAERAHELSQKPQDKDFKLAMHLPAIMVERYLNDNGITMNEFFTNKEHSTRMLKDPNLAAFRVWKGKV